MLSPRPGAATSAPVQLKGGGRAELTLEAVARAALFIASATPAVEVFADVNGRLVPALQLVRDALDGREPLNTNSAEAALHELGWVQVLGGLDQLGSFWILETDLWRMALAWCRGPQ